MKHLFKVILLLLVMPVTSSVYAQLQGQERLDSLLRQLPRLKEDSLKVKVLNSLAFAECDFDVKVALKHAEQGLALSETMGWRSGIAQSVNASGAVYMSLANNDKALECFERALKINQELRDKNRVAQNLGNIALIYENQSDYPKALEYLFKALKIFEEEKDTYSIAVQFGNIANVYYEQHNFKKALHYDSMALERYRMLGDDDCVAMILGNLGNIYSETGQDALAIEMDNEAIKAYKRLGNKAGVARNLSNLSVIYERMKDYYKALQLAMQAYKLYMELDDPDGKSGASINVGDYYLDIATDSLPIRKDSLVPGSKTECLKLAVEYVHKAMEIDSGAKNLKSLAYDYEVLAKAQEASGNYKEAMGSYMAHNRLKDSVFSMESKVKIEHLTTEREIGLKNKQIEIDKLAVAKKRNERVFFISGIGALVLVIFFVFRNYKNERRSNILLSVEKQKSEDLLLNILPSEIAEELKQTGSSAARHFDNVTVLFTDFVNFTGAGERMTPQELVDELDACFKAFDAIISKWSIEKIKTIGDAYLAVAGLPLPQDKHAEYMVNAALEIKTFMRERHRQMGHKTFEIRIGVHSGSVVAGIVGIKKFAYDIWGDTVNTAARMEQHGAAGKVNISQTTYELVKDKFNCEYRGEVEAKGKGVMKMYFVIA